MGRYRKVDMHVWADGKFRALSPLPPCGQGLWFFLLTGPFTGPIPGLFRAGRQGMAEELGWSQEAFNKAFAEVLAEDMIQTDEKALLCWLPNAIKYNPPESPNVVRSWGAALDSLPECPLLFQAIATLRVEVYLLDKTDNRGFGKAFDEVFGEVLGEDCDQPSPNQEQEQEQEDKNPSGVPEAAPPAVVKKRDELPAPMLPVYHAALEAFGESEKAKAIIYADKGSTARELKCLKLLVRRAHKIAPEAPAAFLAAAMKRYRDLCNGRLRGKAAWTPAGLATTWIWSIVVESMQTMPTEEERAGLAEVASLFAKRTA